MSSNAELQTQHPTPSIGAPQRTLPVRAVLFAVLGVLVGGGAALLYIYYLLQPPMADMVTLAQLMGASALVSIILGWFALQLGAGRLLPNLGLKIALMYLAGVAVVFVNIMITSIMMFLSPHDFGLLSTLLLFSAIISVAFAFLLGRSLGMRVNTIVSAAEKLAAGDMQGRVPVESADELGRLGAAFNRMAEQLADSAERQQRMEMSRRELIAAVSHDLRTPLAGMRAMVEALNDGVISDKATVDRYLKTIQHETERLSLLIDDLFELSQIDAGVLKLWLEPTSLEDLLSDTLEAMTPQANLKGVRLEGRLDEPLPPLALDAPKMQRVFYNLVQNAIRHTPADGAIVLTVRRNDDVVSVQVADTGEGISSSDLPHIFDRFYRGEPSRNREKGGAGLGLAIVRGIVEAHGGSIRASSEPGKGTVFQIALPLSTG